jgi:hypothetical protein
MHLADRLGAIPRQLPAGAVSKIEALWTLRNTAPEEQLDDIDGQMESIVVETVMGHIHLRVTMARKNRYVHAARREGRPLAAWMIGVCDRAAETEDR